MFEKRKILCWIVLMLLVFNSTGQSNKLTPCAKVSIINRIKQYDESLEKIFMNNLKRDYIVRFIAKPSYNPEYVFQINKIGDADFEITALLLQENLWNKNNDSIQFKVVNRSVDSNLVFSVDALFKILTDSVSGRDPLGLGEDGITYCFKRKSKYGVKCGETWSPDDNSLLNDVIQVCDNLMLYAQGGNVELAYLQNSINLICKRIK